MEDYYSRSMNRYYDELVHNLGYEWWMLRSAVHLLDRIDPRLHDPVRNALVESLVLHGRNLIHFFFSGRADWRGDWNAEKSLSMPRLNITDYPTINDWYEKANLHVLHLTTERANPVARWPSHELMKILEERVNTMSLQLADQLPEDWIGYRDVGSVLVRNLSGHNTSSRGREGPTGPTDPRQPSVR